MADEPSWDELFTSQPEDARAGLRTENRPAETRRPPKRRLTWLWVLLSIVMVLGIGVTAVFFAFEEQVRSVLGWEEPNDYVGSGSGEVVVTIVDGQVGGDIAKTLVDADVTKSYDAFYDLLLASDVWFQPGSYSLRQQMSAQSALDALQDPANKVETSVLFQEGKSITQVFNALSESTGIPVDDFEAAAADPTVYGAPPEAPSLEGYLFPARYSFEPGVDASAILQTLVSRSFESLDAAGVAAQDRHRVLTIASLIQREAGSNPDDFFKVSRVIQNRLDSGMMLQFDSTAHYGFTLRYGERDADSVFTNADELSDDNAYNPYVHSGLPPGPIGAPGDLAIDAAVHPADGSWLYFVTVNLDTGETAFSATLGEHNAAVRQLQAWCRDTQSPNCG
ncbi:MAG: mltG [Microbacteriaceae bacterium]|nr:mltG [Microbacteriaceae bacterium]